MNLSGRAVWQVATGSSGRSYPDVCLAHDVVIMGPGEPGAVEDDPEGYEKYGDEARRLERFYEEVEKGDVVVLRTDIHTAVGVGVVAKDESEFRELFSDVDGWDVQHSRRVRWLRDVEPKKFDDYTFRWTLRKVEGDVILDWIRSIDVSQASRNRELAALPEPGEELDFPTLGDRLFDAGLPSEYVNTLIETLESVRRVAQWYSSKPKSGGKPSEAETVAYLVVPVLLALGWSEQQVAVEWNQIDVALFDEMPREDSNLAKIMEVKKLKRSVQRPFGQARKYAEQEGRDSCRSVITTNGIRYAVFNREDGNFSDTPAAYLNLLQMRDSYPVLGTECGGAVEGMLELSRL